MKQPYVYAHRGASGYAPENTLPAFEKALEMGADGIEIDVHFSKDGALVVTHDEYIDRVSDGHGFVCQQTLEELRQYNVNCGMEAFGHVQVPELREVFPSSRRMALCSILRSKTRSSPTLAWRRPFSNWPMRWG